MDGIKGSDTRTKYGLKASVEAGECNVHGWFGGFFWKSEASTLCSRNATSSYSLATAAMAVLLELELAGVTAAAAAMAAMVALVVAWCWWTVQSNT